MKTVKIGLIVVGSIIGLLIIAAVGYKLLFSQGVAESFEVNNSDLTTKVLIATQGSGFKDALVSGIIEDLKKKAIYMKVVDVSALPEIKENEWNALVLINTCQSGSLQADVKKYLSQTRKPDHVVLLTTSGSGNWKPEKSPVDSISSASKKKNVGPLLAEILKRVKTILGNG